MSTERHKKIDEAAGDWVARRNSGDWTDEDRRRFDQWLNASPLHRVAYLRIEHVWERSERLRALGAGMSPGVIPPPNAWNPSFFSEQRERAGRSADHPGADNTAGALEEDSPETSETPGSGTVLARRPRRGRELVLATAATVLLIAALGTAYHLRLSGFLYRTPVGGLASVPIADGSKVTLNTDSEIRVAVTETERRIELKQGEAFFEVAKDSTRPFVVHAGTKRVIAVGTKFSVRRDADDIQVIVTEGKVRVETEASRRHGFTEPLTAGTIAQATAAGVLVRAERLAEAEEHLSWRRGVLVFRQMTLADASAEFNRYNTRKIVIEDPEDPEDPGVAALRVAGSFRATNVDAFVRLLERGYPLRAEERGDQFVLSAR